MMDKIAAYRYLYYFIKNKEKITDLEQWLYKHEELEELLGESEYLEFVSRDYKGKYAYHESDKQIRGLIQFGTYEQERIMDLLNQLNQNSDDYLAITEILYDEYCNGYIFLRYIAMTYIMTSDEYQEILKRDNIKMKDYRELINKEARRLLAFLTKEEIIIDDEYEYTDKRKEYDKIEIHSIDEMMKE